MTHQLEKPGVLRHSDSLSITDNPSPEAWASAVSALGGSLYFRPEWDLPFSVYGLRVIRLISRRKEQVTGILPLVHQHSRLFGNWLVSLPWFDSTGLLALDTSSQEALLEAATAMGREFGARSLILRQSEPLQYMPRPRLDKSLLRLSLPSDSEQLWSDLSAKVRNQIRKAEKSSLTYEQGSTELVADFYRVYSINMRDLASPPHSEQFFAAVLGAFPREARLHIVRRDGLAIGCGLTIDDHHTCEIPWASSMRRFNSLCVNHFLYWNILREACRRGISRFHFGRSTKDSGTYRFKRQWGAEDVPLYWYTAPIDSSSPIPADEHTAAEARPERFGLARRAWRLLPLWLVRSIGPQLIRRLA